MSATEARFTEPGLAGEACVNVRLRWIALQNLRNHAAIELTLPATHVVFHGANGAGKTNLLEAVSLLAPGRGLRRASYDQIATKDGPGGFGVGVRLTRDDDSVRLRTGVGPTIGERDALRRLWIDGEPTKTTDLLTDHLRVTWLTPQMDGLFSAPSADRRRFLDRLALAVEPRHGRAVMAYEKAMRQRNRLLADDVQDALWYDALEGEMAMAGAAVMETRLDLIERLNAANDALPERDLFPVADLSIRGPDDGADERAGGGDRREALARAFRDGRRRDMQAGRTLSGPHRDDLAVVHRAKSMPASLASTGEQKALLTGLILGHARLVRDRSAMTPILLLDEIGAHFDAGRRAALFDILDAMGVQAIMTGTEPSLFEALGTRATRFRVDADRGVHLDD